MKAVVASDIHGNLEYTLKLEEFILKEKPEYVILLGDTFGFYNNDQVIDILNRYRDLICAVRGNCDYSIDDVKFNYDNEFLKIDLDGLIFFCTHGHISFSIPDDVDYILSGHTHIYNIDGKHLNPGSVGSPRVHFEHTCFLYEDKKIKLIDLGNEFEVMKDRVLEKRIK